MTTVSVSYEKGLIEDLRNPAEAAHYINAAMEEGSEEMLTLALQDVAKAMQIDDPAYASSFEKDSPASVFSADDGARLCRLGIVFQRMGLKFGVEAGAGGRP
jgi:DNA-binding phage protein